MNRYKLSKAGVDVNKALSRMDNDKDFYESLLVKFCEDPHFQQLKTAVENKDTREAFQAAHALKGISGNMEFNRLYDALNPLVEELRQGRLDTSQELLEKVTEAHESVMEALKGGHGNN